MPYKDPIKRREYHTKYMREVWYPKNKEAHLKRVEARRKRYKKELHVWLDNLKAKKGCADCKIKDFRVLDFDHRPGFKKEFAISVAIRNQYPKERIKKELKKCVVRCANCHRIITFSRRKNAM